MIVRNNILYGVNLEPKPTENPLKIVVPAKLRGKVLDVSHACSRYFGAAKTKRHIQGHFYWPEITSHCKACKTCAAYDSHTQPLKPVPVVSQP